MSDLRSPPRRPGARFEASTPVAADDLPRMDVAAFVGFAAAGPLHAPVAVESEAAFAELFGADLPLGWDPAARAPAYAHLAPAVRAFFRNGGRRCHVVRVALDTGPHRARAARLPLRGLAARVDGHWRPCVAEARSEGSWADDLQVTTRLSLEALPVTVGSLAAVLAPGGGDGPWIPLAKPAAVAPGDGLRVAILRDGALLAEGWCHVAAARREPDGACSWQRGPELLWLRATVDSNVPVEAEWRAADDAARSAAGTLTAAGGDRARLQTESPDAAHASPGCLLELRAPPQKPGDPERHHLLFVDDVTVTRWSLLGDVFDLHHAPLALADDAVTHVSWRDDDDPSLTHRVAVERAATPPGASGWSAPPHVNGGVADHRVASLPAGAVLLLERAGANAPPTPMGYLRLTARVPAAWAIEGPARERLDDPPELAAGDSVRVERATVGLSVRDGDEAPTSLAALDLDPARPRALAMLPSDRELFAPRPRWRDDPHAALRAEARAPRFPLAGGAALRAVRAHPVGLSFGSERSLGPWLSGASALARDGVAALAPTGAPTAAQVDAACFFDPRLLGAPTDGLLAAADRLLHEAADDGAAPPPQGLHGLLTLPEVTLAAAPDAAWAGRTFLLEPSPAPVAALPDPPPDAPLDVGAFHGAPSPAAAAAPPRPARVPPSARWALAPSPFAEEGDAWSGGPLDVQAELLRACAARGDVVALLSAPPHLRARGAARYAGALRAMSYGTERSRALSLGALYHPWCVGREGAPDAPLRVVAPEGAVAGQVADGAARRGAWVSPANRALRGVVALSPALHPEEVDALLAASINALSQEPAGATPLEAVTLTDDDDLRPLGVRRLMTLLRRAALERGERYAFESLGEALLRGVELDLDGLLQRLFDRGALAGRRAADAYRVRASAAPAGVDGRLMVEVRVAPSQPLRFLTIRLEQRGDQTRVAEES